MNGHHDSEIPGGLLRQFRAVERRLLLAETVVSVFGGICGVLLAYAALFLLDRVLDTPAWLRPLFTLAGGLSFAAFAGFWMHRWLWKRRDTRALAVLVQRKYERLGDRLLGAVEIASEDAPGPNVSPALRRAAIRQVSDEAAKYRFTGAVSSRRPMLFAVAGIVTAAVVAVVWLLFPEASRNALLRWAMPLARIERYTFVSLEQMPAELVVPHGEEFEVSCRLSRRSRWKPERAACAIRGQPPIETRVSAGSAVFKIPPQTEPGVLRVRIGDLRRDMKITPVFRPELARLKAEAVLPDYLKRGPQTNRIEGGAAKFVEGSKVRFLGAATRELKTALLRAAPAGTQQPESEPGPAGQEFPLDVSSNSFASAQLRVELLGRCSFSWTDRLDLDPLRPYNLAVSVTKDEPPSADCRGIASSVAVLDDEVVEMEVWAKDDFGVRELWLNWAGGPARDGTEPIRGSRTMAAGGPEEAEVSNRFVFSPLALNVPEESVVTLRACATDYLPGRSPSMSPSYRIYVLSRARHARLIQEKMENVEARIEDVAREEERLLDAHREMLKGKPEELAAEKATFQLKDNEIAERQNLGQLSRLSSEAAELLKEALRNKDIPERTLRRWSELASQMKEVSAGAMTQAANSLKDAARHGEARSANVKKAADSEEQALTQLREMGKKANESIEDMLALNFVNRLRMAASAEGSIGSTLAEMIPEIVGLPPEDLPSDKREKLDEARASHERTRKEAGYIEQDLAGFYNRTRLECYNTVFGEMVRQKTQEELKALSALIEKNMGAQAIGATDRWKRQFAAWADLLQAKSPIGSSSALGQNQTVSQADSEVLLALMRARKREETIREQTRLLEETRQSNQGYRNGTSKLAAAQNELAVDVRPLERRAIDRSLSLLVEKIGGEMLNATVLLRRPQTDSETVAIETEIIELLSNCISMSCGQCGGAGQSLAAMAGMQTGTASGSAGGGSSAGGNAGKTNDESAGPDTGEAPEARDVDKTGGADRGRTPEEFREALEAYFDAIEQYKAAPLMRGRDRTN